jgi:hypothetical protein
VAQAAQVTSPRAYFASVVPPQYTAYFRKRMKLRRKRGATVKNFVPAEAFPKRAERQFWESLYNKLICRRQVYNEMVSYDKFFLNRSLPFLRRGVERYTRRCLPFSS